MIPYIDAISLLPIENGPDKYDLHTEGSSKVLAFNQNANLLLNRPAEFNENYCIVVRLASPNQNQARNWGSVFLIDAHNNKIYMTSDYGNEWSDWKVI